MTEPSADSTKKRLSERFVTFVELFFAVALAASLLQFDDILFPPDPGNISFWALLIVYITAITSWTGWHRSTLDYPYTESRAGILRAFLDATVVGTYIALLFIGSRATHSLGGYLFGFTLIFVLYLVLGLIRRAEHGPEASKPRLIIYHGIPMVAVFVGYIIWSRRFSPVPDPALWIFVFLPLVIIVCYRWSREWHELPWIPHQAAPFSKPSKRVAIDVDGVLVEQVTPVLHKLNREMGLELSKCDITDWEYTIEETNIKAEIERAEREREFVQHMPAIEGALEALSRLVQKYHITIATSREEVTDPWTREWLDRNGIRYDRLVNTRKDGKLLPDADILIDDYVPNINTFLRSVSQGREAVLFAQPWNHDTTPIADLLQSGKVRIAHSWNAILAILG
jgi:5'(3')-deoxyribonucleotidase